jgi:hypothetical protein
MITINGTLAINEGQNWVFLTLPVDGDMCQVTHVVPSNLSGQELQDFVDAREETYEKEIIDYMYPAELEGDKVPWTNVHPPFDTDAKKQLKADAKNLMDGSDLLNKSFFELEDFIDSNNANIPQIRDTLKEVVKNIAAIAQRMNWSE